MLAAQGGLQDALERKTQCEHTLAQRRSEMKGSTASCGPAMSCAARFSAPGAHAASASPNFNCGSKPPAWAVPSMPSNSKKPGRLVAVAQSITEGNVRLHGLQAEIDRLHRQITALGAVNLAALQELQAGHRAQNLFVDAQVQDLTQAMTTLRRAIRKIDAQTRELLSGTFNAVNAHFGRMFPELFGGGQRD